MKQRVVRQGFFKIEGLQANMPSLTSPPALLIFCLAPIYTQPQCGKALHMGMLVTQAKLGLKCLTLPEWNVIVPIHCVLLGRERYSKRKVSCQEHNTVTCTRTGTQPRPHDPESSTSINHEASTSQNANAVATFFE